MGTQRSLLFLPLLFLNSLLSHAQTIESSEQPNYPAIDVSSTVAVIIVVMISVFFSMVFFSLYLRRCTEADPFVLPTNAPHSHRGLRAGGLDKAVVDSFPTMVYFEVKELKLGKGTLECAVCLCEFEDSETLRLLPKCNHAFHTDCIGMWLDSHSTCPVCRADLSSGAVAAPAEPQPADVAVRVEEEEAVEGEREREERRREWTEEERERFTLRLPEGLREEMMSRRLDRSATVGTGLAKWGRGGRSFKREWSAKSDRWAFLGRTWSLRPARTGRGGDGSRREKGESSTAAEEMV